MKTKKRVRVFILMALIVLVVPSSLWSAEPAKSYMLNGQSWKYGIETAIGFNENTFKTIAKKTTNDNWRDGSVTANGEMGFIESCDPDEDVFIFNNTKIVTDTADIYETPDISNILVQQKKGAVTRSSSSDFPWATAVNSYATNKYGTGWGTTWPRPYQPASQLRIKNNSYTAETAANYNRYTNYETGEVGTQWKDSDGNEWNRRSFSSRSDDIIVTYIEAPDNQDLNITMSMDHIVEMRNQGTVYPRPDSDYIVTNDASGYTIGMVGKYPIRNRKGSKNLQKTLFSYGGWGTATRIVTTGTVNYEAAKRSFTSTELSKFGGGTITNANDPKVTITGTKSVMLITKVDRQDDGCNTVADVKTELYDRLISDIDNVITKYSVTSSTESYDKLLTPHVTIHGGMFNNVRMDLCNTDLEKADRALTNTALIAKQNSNKKVINKAFTERIYNNGRFGLICASGYGTTRLGAIWNGAWMPDWSGDYTLDANTNLQVSGLNTSNMEDASQGYVNFILRMVDDWEADATNVYGMSDAIKAPPRVDGTGEAGSYHFIDGWPHVYVNGITDWLILPIFEYWQCYGNRQIKVGKDIDIEKNKRVLNLSDEDITRIKTTGYMDLEKDILYPMLTKTMNFWLQFVDDKFYTDGSGNTHLDDGTTLSDAIAAGDTDAKYLYTPGYSPENSPTETIKGSGENTLWALTYNTTMDISASRDTLYMARTILDVIKPDDANQKLNEWASFESKIPDFKYGSKGELKEWATDDLAERQQHRHVSHAYAAWPAYQSQDDAILKNGIETAMQLRSAAYNGQEASESHGATHKSLIEARLKNPSGLAKQLLYLMTNNYQYSSMMTSHNNNHASTYCTDSAFGIMGAVDESLLYSNTGKIEILPTLVKELDKGSVSGLRARCNTLVNTISWDRENKVASVTMTSDADTNNTIQLKCGLSWSTATINDVKQTVKADAQNIPYIDLTLTKGASVTVAFTLSDTITISSDTDMSGRISTGTTIKFSADYKSDSGTSTSGVQWKVVNAANEEAIPGVTISQDGTFTVGEEAMGKILKVYAQSSDETIKSNELILGVSNVGPNSGGDAAEIFTTHTMVNYGDCLVAISNDKIVKNITVIWASYDDNDKLVGMTTQDVSLGENEFKKLTLPPNWDVAAYKSSVFLWDKDTSMPYTNKTNFAKTN